jgi:molybdopterin-guanine dinucleotide biosynthesis protein A
MGGRDKGLLPLAGEPLIAHSIRRLQPQVTELLISANRHLEIYQQFGCRVIQDSESGFRGPLAGILSALQVARTPYVLTAPCDSPRLPSDYAQRMWAVLERDQTISVASYKGDWQPVFMLLPVTLQDDLAGYLAAGEGGVKRWLQRHQPAAAEFPDWPRWFCNVNTPDDLTQLETHWRNGEMNP